MRLPKGWNADTDGPAVFGRGSAAHIPKKRLDKLRAVGAAAATKKPDELTDEEKVGLALHQRCQLDIGSYDGHYILRPVNRVEFKTVDGRLRVVEKPRR